MTAGAVPVPGWHRQQENPFFANLTTTHPYESMEDGHEGPLSDSPFPYVIPHFQAPSDTHELYILCSINLSLPI